MWSEEATQQRLRQLADAADIEQLRTEAAENNVSIFSILSVGSLLV